MEHWQAGGEVLDEGKPLLLEAQKDACLGAAGLSWMLRDFHNIVASMPVKPENQGDKQQE